jgi:hypothetical protein
MIKKYLCKVLVVLTFTIYGLELNSIGASASWKQDSNGWWNTEGSSYSIGWKEIDGKWYYFNSDGYMAHDTTINSYILGSDGAWIQSTYTNTTTQGNQKSNSDSFDVNVSLKYNINLDDKVKGTNPNIIKATRQAIFDEDCYCAKLEHYNGYSVNNDVLIFDVKEAGTDTWEVDFYEKKLDEKEYDTSGYSVATVEKQKDGSYTGGLTIHPPFMPAGETY